MRKEAVGTRSRGFTLTERVQEEWLAMVCGYVDKPFHIRDMKTT